MRFYVATRLENFEEQRELAERLVDAGHWQTYNWTVGLTPELNFTKLWESRTEFQMKTTGLAEQLGVEKADVVIVLLPGGRGTHVELGLALGSGSVVVLVSDPETPYEVPFYHNADYHVAREGDWMGKVVELMEEI